ncbi:putative phage protein (predicted DNA packaging) [Clostridium acetobutylicum]|uniref:Phage related protein, possible DNA packing n=1 Tax=Clostridium acetobutylicum (strain ATCC 824 / DSM 792 / JCM 1419 / IAM 19013 / LMG 5710 / NBRC 13948 / NRRL B-527 / VKM B-1787 / 2291 / W) TaxID=272562 RepID=Q97HW6_CLOAB|nr:MULTISPECIES: head-tail connector protein [Clostridium]AAK79854.1 Phage related protein, possible DNA packing [Clostridium acetobutylicum ATCC 824]ADZ20940.1 Phage related protein [Clostridium acetobutylicum EA 2018]AEI32030.1 Phage related protein, DNA packing [Clostridium acetobutylicum DSM 1731]AWV79716.1 hypothetical protein DK921_06310 [Clostridium acetobutylicum]MBC2394306.1 hypothetical protein [Clostridium acetobutylicum]
MVTLDQLKLSLRIDTSDDDTLLTLFMQTASDYIKGSIGNGVTGFYDSNPRFDTALILLTDHYYKTRSATDETDLKKVPFGVTTLILQLKGDYLYALQQSSQNSST